MPPSFSVTRLPRIEFGSGSHRMLPDTSARYGRRLLMVTGTRSLGASEAGFCLTGALRARRLFLGRPAGKRRTVAATGG